MNGTELKGRAQLNDGDSFSIAYRAFVFRNAAYAKRREHPNPFGKGETSAAPDVNVSNVPEAAPKQDTQQQTVKPTAEQKTETKAEPTRGTQPAASTTTTKCAATPKDGKGSSKATKVLYNAFSSHVACSFNELNREREKALAAAARGEKVSRNNTLKPYCAALFQKIEPYGQIYYEAPGRRREKGAQPGLPEKRQKTQPIDS